MLVGVYPDRARHDGETVVDPHSTLLLYTDGLVEDPDTDIREGIERLCDALAKFAGLPLDPMLDAVIDAVVGAGHADDIAVLAARFTPDPANSTAT